MAQKRAFAPRAKVDHGFTVTLGEIMTTHLSTISSLAGADFANLELASMALQDMMTEIVGHVGRIPKAQWHDAAA
eukprot:5573244-Amphidinium_carterae.1